MNTQGYPVKILLLLLFSFLTKGVFSNDKAKALDLFKERHEKSKLEESIRLMEGVLAKEKDYDLAITLSRAWYLLAEHAENNDQRLERYDKGVKAGEKAMGMIPVFAGQISTSAKEEDAIKTINKENLDALYWTAANLARWAKFASFTKKISSKARVRYLWDRVYEIDPSFFYGGAYRFFGSYYALVPSITGDQDPVKSGEMFQKAVAAAPEYLETKILYAEAYCTHAKIKNRELFKKLLNEVIQTDLKAYPDIYAENLIARGKAEKLMSEEQDLFE
jgi:hypothetical protein